MFGSREKPGADAVAAMFRIYGNTRDKEATIVAQFNEWLEGRIGSQVIWTVTFLHRKRVQHADRRVREFGKEAVLIGAGDSLAGAPAGTSLNQAFTWLCHLAPDVFREAIRRHQKQSGDLEAVLAFGRSDEQLIAW